METRVVNIRKEISDVYIGRAGRGAFHLYLKSKWANPFHIRRGCTRAQALAKYEAMVRNRPDLMAALPELEGKRLGCWCKPKACHGDVLVKLLEERKRGAQ